TPTATVTFTPGALAKFLVEAAGGGDIAAQTAGTAFNIRITAQDANNNTVTSFDGGSNKATITSTGTLSAGGGQTPSFTNGVVSSYSVTISNTGNFTITATNGAAGGTSNAFDMTAGVVGKFAIGTISSPKRLGTAFSSTITAQDANNNTASFGGTVDLNTTAGRITPVTSGAFSGGVRTQSVTVTQAGTGKTITATRTGGSETGTSNTFT